MCYHPENQRVNISGIGNHLINYRCLATFCAIINTDVGPKLGVQQNYAYVPEKQGTIHSKMQMQAYSMLISDTLVALGGQEMMTHPDGFHIPLVLHHVLHYICQCYPTKDKFLNLQQIIMTDDANWDPWIYDNDHLPDNIHLHHIQFTIPDHFLVYVNTNKDIDYINDLSVPSVT